MSHAVLPPSVQPSKRETPGLPGPVAHPVVGRLWRLGAVVGALNLTIWLVVGGAWTKLLGIW